MYQQKISIITVCYNSASTIEDTILSVIKQTYRNIEYIIIDGLSKDNTIDIVNKYKNNISKIISEKDNGLYDAMNKGINMATGDIIGILNSDDIFCDEYSVEKVMNVFNNNSKLDSVYGDIYYVSQTDTDKIVRRWKTGEQRKFITGWHPAHPTFYVKKSIYDKLGGFTLSYKLASDFEIMLRFLECGNISAKYLPEPLIKMRLGGETNKSLKNILSQNKECVKAFEANNIKINPIIYLIRRLIPKIKQFF